MEKVVAGNFETKEPQPDFNQNDDERVNLPSASPPVESDDSHSVASARIVPNRDSIAAKTVKPKQNTKIATSNDFNAKTQEKSPEKQNIALTRGGASPKCGDQPEIDLAVETSDEKVVLKWKKVPNAAKYHLYVSDENEILLDEYETERETAYALTKPLDPLKTYQMKIIITLENGNTVVGDSQKFTVKNARENQKKSGKMRKSDVRCSANN